MKQWWLSYSPAYENHLSNKKTVLLLFPVFLKVTPKADVHRDLSEMLKSKLNKNALEKFKLFLPFTCFYWNLQQISAEHLGKATTAQKLADLMMKEFGQRSVEVARKVLMEMNVPGHGEKKSEGMS